MQVGVVCHNVGSDWRWWEDVHKQYTVLSLGQYTVLIVVCRRCIASLLVYVCVCARVCIALYGELSIYPGQPDHKTESFTSESRCWTDERRESRDSCRQLSADWNISYVLKKAIQRAKTRICDETVLIVSKCTWRNVYHNFCVPHVREVNQTPQATTVVRPRPEIMNWAPALIPRTRLSDFKITSYRVSCNHMHKIRHTIQHVKCNITCATSFRFWSNCLYVILSKILTFFNLFDKRSWYLVWLFL